MTDHAASCTVILVECSKALRRLARALASRISRLFWSAHFLVTFSAESGVKRNIPGPCGKALAGSGDPGWGDGGRDASDVGGEGAAGRVQGRAAEPAGDRAGARPGGLDRQPRATA